jgi:hypothetical protein
MKRILSLFDHTGNWPTYFAQAGWDVITVDIQDGFDLLRVKNMEDALNEFEDIDAVIAAPPCTDFSSSGAWTWPSKDSNGTTKASLELVHQTMRLIDAFIPTDPDYDGSFFWALENPVGRIAKLVPELGEPWYFNPYEYAGWLDDLTAEDHLRIEELRIKPYKNLSKDDIDFIQWANLYTKKTGIWGDFKRPEKKPIEPIQGAKQGSIMQRYGGKSIKTKNARSATPHGFAKAFWAANDNDEPYVGKDDTMNGTNQHTVNKQIETLVEQIEPNTITDPQKEFIRTYAGSGGLGSKGAKGEGLLYEFFTPDWLAERMAQLAYKHGFKKGSILEPSIATGELIRPFYNDGHRDIVGFEINPTSTKISQLLYPEITLYNQYFETAFLQSPRFTSKTKSPWIGNDFDLVIGNPPFGVYKNQYSSYFNRKLFKQIEILFIYQSLQVLKSGGLLVFLQSSNFLSNGEKYQYAKEQIGKIAKLVDAYRLPKVFATTDVPTDIMILEKL